MPADKRKQFLKNIEQDAGRIQNIVDRMLQLAALESKRKLEQHQTINLTKLVKRVIEEFNPQIKFLTNFSLYRDLSPIKKAADSV